MGKPSKPITKEIDEFIRSNHELMNLKDLSKAVQMPYVNVYNYMIRNKIPISYERCKKTKIEKPPGRNDGYFDVDDKTNWMI